MVSAGCLIGCLILVICHSLVSGLCSTCQDGKCHENGECIIGCVPGYVGEYCDEACPPRCLNKACSVQIASGVITCTDGCEPGYCDIKCEVQCPGNCVTCDRQCGSCNVTLCPERHYGAECREVCSPRYEKCDRETGQCIRCGRGYFGDECTRACTGCFTPAENLYDACLSGCEMCQTEETCPVRFFGDSCELRCSTGCENPGGCNRATGECSTVCVSGYHGLTCNYTCSEHCLSERCNRATGECPTGCVSGYYGLTCNYMCNIFCKDGICNQHDGLCTSGCISGYKFNLDTCEKYDNEGFNTTVAIAVPTIILVCLVGIAIVVVIWRRRRFRRPNSPRTDHVEKGMKGTDVAEPLLKYKKEEAPQQLPEDVQRLKTRTREEIESITTGMIRVSAVDDVLHKLKAGQRWVTITGNAGDGKTTLGYLVLNEFLKEKVNVFTIFKPEEYDQIEKIKGDRVIMFEDRFGAFIANQQLIKSWVDAIGKFLSFNENNQQNNQVIFISRKNEPMMHLERFSEKIFDPKCVVDLSMRNVTGERLKILEYHLQHENVIINVELKKKISNKAIAHGFPHCCKMFSKLRSNKYDVDIEEFFESPLKFLDMTTKVLYKDNCKDLFQLMIKNDGKFNLFTMEEEEKRQKLLQVEKGQEGSYITVWRNGVCQFAHPSMYESVLNVINDIDPVYFVQYATLSVIRQKMIISTSDEEDRSKSACYIIVKPIPDVLKALAERFREELVKGDYSVFTHRLCQSREFCEVLVSCCVTTDKKEEAGLPEETECMSATGCSTQKRKKATKRRNAAKKKKHNNEEVETSSKQFINRPGKDGATMLCTAVRNRCTAAVHCLVKADADVNIQDERGRTPLHYICQLKNYTGASTEGNEGDDKHKTVDLDSVRMVITEGRGDVNIGDQYGQTPLHYLCKVMNSAAAVGHYDDKLHHVVMNAMKLIITEGRGNSNIGDQYGQTPLHYLCQVGNFAAEDYNGHNDDKLHCFVMSATELIMTEGSGDINISDCHGQTPLHYLFKCCTFTTEDIQWIIVQGKTRLNKCEQNKSTPLHYLCANSNLQLDTVDLVIKEGKGDFNQGDEHGTTPFHYLCKNGKIERDVVLQVVNAANGDINKQDDNGITPLHVLCKRSPPIQNILTLIKQGDKADIYGNTPLHYLCRRRGIIAEVLQQQLEQIPETDGRKQNNLGYTALDYLTDQDGSLPWTDGMIARSAADLVLCRLKHGDNWTVVLGRAMILNSERVHKDLQVEDFGRVLTNLEESGHRNSPGQFSWFRGTCSSPVPVPPSPSPLTTPPSYWETSSSLTRRERGGIPLLEIGLIQGRSNMDEDFSVSVLPDSVCVSVRGDCLRHPVCLCIQVWRKDQEDRWRHQVGECVSLSLPTPGVEFTFTFGLVLDVGRGRVGFIDVERGELLCKLDLQMKDQIFPMFFVDPFNDRYVTRMRLISGREICVTDRKIQLIQQALSD